ncbi:putative uncharacterized protein [Dialister sp. CAG:357]|nr:putative uncharacterized protein [Dialister sp. CAG:357]
MHTLLPLPVEPAINKCGIFDKSVTTGFPVISFPKATRICPFPFWNSSLARTSLRGTGIILLFGISIPTADLPGIGASMRICVAASAIASSFDKPSILLTLTPISGLSSNLVTVGPTLALITFAPTPKLASVDSMILALCWISSCLACTGPSVCSSDSGGNTYS